MQSQISVPGMSVCGRRPVFGERKRENERTASAFHPPHHGQGADNYGNEAQQPGFRTECAASPQFGAALNRIEDGSPKHGVTADWKAKYVALKEVPGDMDAYG